MRKLFTLLILVFLWAGSSWAQVNTYSFAYSSGTYTEITGGTVLGAANSDDQRFVDPAVPLGGTVTIGVGFPIGFNFTYDGVVYDRFAVNNNGWISLGRSALTPSVNIASTSSYVPLSSTSAITPAELVARIAGAAFDLQGQAGSELRIQTIGVTPSQICVIQFKNYRGYGAAGDNLNYQIRLLEGTNQVQIVYGTMTKGTTSGLPQLGLRGAPVTPASNFSTRTTTADWAATTAGTAGSQCTLSTAIYPVSGATYTFSTPIAGTPDPPSSPSPANLASGVPVSGSLTWTFGANTATYDLLFGPTGSMTQVVTGATAGATGTYVYSGLNTSAIYQWQVIEHNGTLTTTGPIWSFTTVCGTFTVPFTENFDSYTVPAVGCGTVIDVNADLVKWVSATGTPYNGLNKLRIGYSATGVTQDDWYITPGIVLAAGQSYDVKFWYKGGSSSYLESMEVKYGASPTAAGMTSVAIFSDLSFYKAAYTLGAATFVATNAGTYYFGWHCISIGNQLNIDVDQITIEATPTCPSPLTVTATAVSSSSISIGWTGTPTTVQIDYGAVGHTAGSGTLVSGVTLNPTTVTGLTSNTSYDVFVRQDCGSGSYSPWTGPVTVFTLCGASTTFSENFDAVTAPAMPNCWAKVGTSGSAYTQASSSNSSPNCLYLYGFSGATATVSMPPLSNAGANTHQLRFKARASSTVGGIIEVGYLTNPLDAATFVSVQSFTIGALTYSEYISILGTAPGANQVLAFRHSGVPANSVLIDDVAWELQPACAQVSALTATGITGSSAVLGWNANGTTAWQIEWGASGFTPTGTPNIPVATNPYTLSGLTPVTAYSYYVRANCGVNGFSVWTGPYTFTTTVACPAPTAQVVTGITATQASLGWTNPGAALWDIEWGLSGFVQGTGTIVSASSNPYVLTGLTAATAYSWYVRQNCGGSQSAWTSVNTFTTACNASSLPFGTEDFAVAVPPSCWTRRAGLLAAPSTLTTTTSGWAQDDWRNVTTPVNKAAKVNVYGTTINYWLMTPQINLGAGSSTLRLEFDLALNAWNTSTAPSAGLDDRFAVVISTDGGLTWTSANTLREWNNTGSTYVYDNINYTSGEHVNIPLAGYTGTVMIGFYGESTVSNGDNDLMIDNVAVQEPPACSAPSAIVVSAITATTATISWTAASPAPASGYQWEVRTSGAGGSGATGLVQSGSTSVGTVIANVAGLTSATTYNVYVRSNCGAGNFSTWAGPSIFATSCGVFNLPYAQNFDAVTAPAIPLCWTIYSSAALRPWLTQSTTLQPLIGARSEPNFAAIFYSATAAKNEWLVSPGVQLTAGVAYRAKFFVQAPGFAGIPESMKLTVSTDPSLVGVAAGTVIWNDPNMLYASYTEINAPFTPTTTGIYYFAWHAYSIADVDYIAMDDIAIELVPACDSPSAITATAITQTTATISWTASVSNPSLGYQYEVRTSGAAGSGATGLITSGSTAAVVVTANITGLPAATSYSIYVRSHCTAVEYSAWGSGSFSTLCGIVPTPFVETVEVGELSPCWSLIPSAGVYNWQIVSGASGYGVGSQSFRANFYSIPALEIFTLLSPEFNSATLTNPLLEFDYAYAAFPGSVDEMNVYYSTDGGATFTLLLAMPGGEFGILNTAGVTSSGFVPTAAQWATQSLALPAGTNQVTFEAISDYGNNLYLDNIKIIEAPITTKTLNLTNVRLEHLFVAGTGGLMNQAYNEVGPKFSAPTADVITIELHDATTYSIILRTYPDVPLTQTGTASVTGIDLPGGNYRITIKHRNSIETTSMLGVDFTGATIAYSFGTAGSAFGNNLKLLDGFYCIYGGDVNQGGQVDGADVSAIENGVNSFVRGYDARDVDGSGDLGISDYTIWENNNNAFIQKKTP